MAKINLNNDQLEKIRSAVEEAESNTSGEIATAFIRESDNYAIYELMFAFIVGFVYFVVLLFFSPSVEAFIKNMFWEYSSDYLIMFYGFSTFMVIALIYLLANIPIIDRLIVPKSTQREKVNQRAMRYFMESGVYDTKDRTGILIFISWLERRVELLADKGISEKISQEKWNSLLAHIINGIKAGEMVKSLCESIGECGKLLSLHYPIQADDVNELKDDIALLEK